MSRVITIGGVVLLLVLIGLAVLGLRSCAEEPDKPIAKVDGARDAALIGVAAEGNGIIANAMTEAAEIDTTTKENDRAIRSTPGADTPVPAAVNDAGLRALCVRAAYRDQPRCTALLGPRPGTAGR